MKKVLAIINEPQRSREFIQYLTDMALDLKADIQLLYGESPITYPIGTTGATGAGVAQIQTNQEASVKASKEMLAKQIKVVKSKVSEDVNIEYSAEIGESSLLAQELVTENNVDMVVLESQRNKSFWTQSSSNMEIIERVECPVLIVSNTLTYEAFSHIIYATDYKEEDITGLKKLISFTANLSPKIVAMHITDNVDFEENVKKAGFHEILQKKVAYDRLQLVVLTESNSNDIAELVNDYALQNKADLIVVNNENKSFFERIFKSGPAEKIIKSSKLPVLVF